MTLTQADADNLRLYTALRSLANAVEQAMPSVSGGERRRLQAANLKAWAQINQTHPVAGRGEQS